MTGLTPHETSQFLVSYLSHILLGQSLSLESPSGCGRLGDPSKTECIWDCDWVDNPFFGDGNVTPNTGSFKLDFLLRSYNYKYSAVKYPSNLSCLADCDFLNFKNDPDADFDTFFENKVTFALSQRPNIDAFIFEICIIYFELNRLNTTVNTCLPKPVRRKTRKGNKGRLIGNSLTNSYNRSISELEKTLRQYPWACSLR